MFSQEHAAHDFVDQRSGSSSEGPWTNNVQMPSTTDVEGMDPYLRTLFSYMNLPNMTGPTSTAFSNLYVPQSPDYALQVPNTSSTYPQSIPHGQSTVDAFPLSFANTLQPTATTNRMSASSSSQISQFWPYSIIPPPFGAPYTNEETSALRGLSSGTAIPGASRIQDQFGMQGGTSESERDRPHSQSIPGMRNWNGFFGSG